jgi:hypothetical protein
VTPYHWKNALKRREIGKRKGKKNKAEKLRQPKYNRSFLWTFMI